MLLIDLPQNTNIYRFIETIFSESKEDEVLKKLFKAAETGEIVEFTFPFTHLLK